MQSVAKKKHRHVKLETELLLGCGAVLVGATIALGAAWELLLLVLKLAVRK